VGFLGCSWDGGFCDFLLFSGTCWDPSLHFFFRSKKTPGMNLDGVTVDSPGEIRPSSGKFPVRQTKGPANNCEWTFVPAPRQALCGLQGQRGIGFVLRWDPESSPAPVAAAVTNSFRMNWK
jgi:hypothetical protein